MSTYLVTGGLGVVGSRFAEKALDSGHNVIIIDAMEELRNVWMQEKLFQKYGFNKLEIIARRLEKFNLAPVIEKSDFILHAAAHTGIPHSANDPNDDWVSNVDASRSILETMRVFNFKKPTVMLSSVKPYKIDDIITKEFGDRTIWPSRLENNEIDSSFVNPSYGIDESCPLEPDEPYAASKMAQSGLVQAYAKTYDLPVTVLRCSNLYGDAPCHGPRHGWLTWFCISAALGLEIEIQGTGKQTRDMLFSDDVAAAVFKSFDKIDGMKGRIFNIGGGVHNQISCLEAVSYLKGVSPVNVGFGPGRINEDMLFTTNYSKFNNMTGWDPTVGVTTGMEAILKWAQQNSEDLRKMYGL